MCVVSMVMDHYGDRWGGYNPSTSTGTTGTLDLSGWPVITPTPITPDEIIEFRGLLDRARRYDEENGEKDCELESKKETLRKLAKGWGVELGDL